jgi:hypothetical protein
MEPVGLLACTRDGAYLANDGASSRIDLWEVSFLLCAHVTEGTITSQCFMSHVVSKSSSMQVDLILSCVNLPDHVKVLIFFCFFGILGCDWAVAEALASSI